MKLKDIVSLPDGPERTAALVAWFQGLFESEECPVLVGGAAVELYTDGGYRTGDLGFVGQVSPGVAKSLIEALAEWANASP